MYIKSLLAIFRYFSSSKEKLINWFTHLLHIWMPTLVRSSSRYWGLNLMNKTWSLLWGSWYECGTYYSNIIEIKRYVPLSYSPELNSRSAICRVCVDLSKILLSDTYYWIKCVNLRNDNNRCHWRWLWNLNWNNACKMLSIIFGT